MSWTDITVAQVSADAIINTLLMGALRNDLYYLKATSGQIFMATGSRDAADAAYDIIVDDSVDWRDRFVAIQAGFVAIGNTIAHSRPGGTSEEYITSQTSDGAHPTWSTPDQAVCQLSGWMYTANGGASRTARPYLTWNDGVDTDWYLWVDTTGRLRLGYSTARATNYRKVEWNLMLLYSEDAGGH